MQRLLWKVRLDLLVLRLQGLQVLLQQSRDLRDLLVRQVQLAQHQPLLDQLVRQVRQVLPLQDQQVPLVLTADLGAMVTLSNASAVTVTVGTSLGFSAGQSLDLLSLGAGQVTIAAGGATLAGTPGLKLRTQYSSATLYCIGSNSFVLIGDLSA